MSELIEYTPLRLPTMTSPAWPDNTRKELEADYALPEKKAPAPAPAKKKQKKKQKAVVTPTEPAEEQVVQEQTPAAEPERPTESVDTRSSFTYQIPREAEPRGYYVENPVEEPSESGNWFSRMIAPPKDELEAANNGLRWHWALEHRFMPPGSKWNETVWQGADRENAWLAQMLRQRPGAQNEGIMSPLAKVRLRGQWLSERNKAINDYINGNWDDPDRAYKEFQEAIGKIDEKLISLGEDPALLRPVPPVSGKRAGFTTQAGPFKLRKNWNYANDVNEHIKDWITTGKINDPNFMSSQETKNYLDAVSETVVKYIKESSNSMADAEKKRLQILMLTDEGMGAVERTIRNYQKALAGVMASASAKEWSQNNRGKVNEIIKAMGFEPSDDPETLGAQIAALGGIIVASLSRNDELPHDVAQDLEAIQSQYEAYMDNMMFAANVDPRVVAQMAKVLGDLTAAQYNDQAYAAGRGIADKLGTVEDLTNMVPKGSVPLSPLLKFEPTFTWPSLAKKPGGDVKVTSNPASEGENQSTTDNRTKKTKSGRTGF